MLLSLAFRPNMLTGTAFIHDSSMDNRQMPCDVKQLWHDCRAALHSCLMFLDHCACLQDCDS